ncbi:Metal-sulfur cluster biosynthetic enzyme [Lentzea albidocapillata subsp. violacea]|uniref:Metal-sulfur cluster biosynthetic enzyme n=1 Tax=Lentzea albidocapillata subsp. violacea TaxID=128104 RepID=A0A1G9QXG0_9PSEU|nr:iron-sulfur cluster assembly protein [Lentzea albidocapillata]SDM15560.1 Metal-sulfur cluster biosynthetic enzyme [Lentzea albidocapillata subsp. violacea]
MMQAWKALDEVMDPELDEPITTLGFVRSVVLDGDVLTVHLRLPTAFCSPNFAYLMASDAKDVLRDLAPHVLVVLEDHHDSDMINRGVAADAGFVGTYGAEASRDLEELRLTFQRKAHAAAMERAVRTVPLERLRTLTLQDLPESKATEALRRRRSALGFGTAPDALVLVDDHGVPLPPGDLPLRLRFARSVGISIEGNAHFCRGLLRTRYAMEETA